MDYYKLSNELRYQCQLIHKQSQNVFEVCLNTSILCETYNTPIIEKITENLAKISKDINQETKKILEYTTNVCRYTLDIKRNYILYDKFKQALLLVDKNSLNILENSLQKIRNEIRHQTMNSIENIQHVNILYAKLYKLNEKVWVSLNNIKIEMSTQENLSAFEQICLQFEDITQGINTILININQFQKNLLNILENELK